MTNPAPRPRITHDPASWQTGYNAGMSGGALDCPREVADPLAYASGYVEGMTALPVDHHQLTQLEVERRGHVRTAIADSRIEGFPPPSRPELEIWAAYIRGEIEAQDLVDAFKLKVRQQQVEPSDQERRSPKVKPPKGNS